ncbi:MAG: hypothetical protein ACK47G_01505 [Pseudanabaena sp.]
MFAQFRSQYPQGRIQTEMLPKIDGLHAFRAIVSQGDAIMGTATAVDGDLELAEDRAVKRALTIAGIAFDNGFDSNYSNYAGRSPILTQISREPASVNSLPSANLNNLGSLGTGHHTTTHTIQSETALEYVNEYGVNDYATDDNLPYVPSEQSHRSHEEIVTRPSELVPSKSSDPIIAPEPIDLSDAISKIDVEMDRLNWTKPQGRDYLVRTFDKKSRQQLTNDELLQFLSYLKSLPTPYRQPANNDDFF